MEYKLKKYNNHFDLLVVFVILLPSLTLSLDVVVTVLNETLHFVNAQQQNITKTGFFNYTQTDTLANPDWIDTGNWSLTESPTIVLTFEAVINMVKPDGSEAHEHVIRDLVIPYAPINQTNFTIIKGTTTITISDGLFYSKVPTTITLNEKNISVYFHPSKIGTHYGNQSITGSVI